VNVRRLLPLQRLRNERGQALLITTVALVALVSMSALVVDYGILANARRRLQASSDTAATAGALQTTVAAAVNAAQSYSAIPGPPAAKNFRGDLPNVTANVSTLCLTTLTNLGISCSAPIGFNAVRVTQTAVVPLMFARLLGYNTMTISATATAGRRGGVPRPIDLAFVIDTTASMNDNRPCPGVGTVSRIDCALAGARALLNALWPCKQGVSGCSAAEAVDMASLFLFPGLTDITQPPLEYDCSGSPNPLIAPYTTTTEYLIVPLTHDFKTSNTSPLNTSSNLVKAVRGGCAPGLEVIGGVGTYYAAALSTAQATLASAGRPDVQNAIVLLSDGDANADADGGDISPSMEPNQCHQAITAAQSATAAGTWIYSVAYGASTSSSSSCNSDSPRISACETMRQIASDPGKFFSTNLGSGTVCTSSANPTSSLIQIFTNIGQDLTTTRLIDDGTP
jgi:hypothetical protein